MKCPNCNEELSYHDYYGFLASHQSGERLGEVFICENEDCESHHFYTDKNDELHEGYPC